MRAIFESAFDIIYLVIVIYAGQRMLRKGQSVLVRMFGVMALILGVGDAFHLLPRVASLWLDAQGAGRFTAAMGFGKLVTSLTMTAFYLLFYYVWRERYGIRKQRELTAVMWALSAVRAALCLLPGNDWFSATPPLSYGIARNIPFLLMGIIIITLFWRQSRVAHDRLFWHIPLAVTLSFLFYIPVVLFSSAAPAVGMLMIPKTLAYLWIVYVGWRLCKEETDAPRRNLK